MARLSNLKCDYCRSKMYAVSSIKVLHCVRAAKKLKKQEADHDRAKAVGRTLRVFPSKHLSAQDEEQTMSKHTLGPWKSEVADEYQFARFVITSVEDDHIGEVSAEDVNNSECEANARLISAAPDLLAALKIARVYAAQKLIENVTGLADAIESDLDQFAAAIAKAEPHDLQPSGPQTSQPVNPTGCGSAALV